MSPDQWRPWNASATDGSHGAVAEPSFPWIVDGGEFMASLEAPRIVTTNYFSHYLLHLDFLIPTASGNLNRSDRDVGGVVLNGKYEIQLADSYGQPAGLRSLGAIFDHQAPLTNAAAPPGAWQSMEIAFAQNQDEPAMLSVWVDGVLVQDRVQLRSATSMAAGGLKPANDNPSIDPNRPLPRSGDPLAGPIVLDAKPGVRFANARVQPLAKIDHATLIRQWDEQSLARGRKIYNGLCITCHGNQEIDGSLPTSRKFWEAEFLNGADPRGMFKTLTEGFGQMPPQPWMTPEMAYDVIHYIREELVRPTNPKAYFPVSESYLAGLPKSLGTTLAKTKAMREFEEGPQYLRMNFGPVLNWTYEVAPGNIAYKGIAVRLDEGEGGISRGESWMLYDHDTMRVAAGWSGDEFIDWRGIAFDGSHQTHSSIGTPAAFANPVGPGWADPKTGSFDDPRFRGRDGKPYGPLPREWAHYKGTYRNGGRTVIAYTVGDARIIESPGRETSGDIVAYSRTVNVGRSSRDLVMRVAPEDKSVVLVGRPGVDLEQQNGFQVIRMAAANTPVRFKVLVSDCDPGVLYGFTLLSEPAEDLEKYAHGGPAAWNQTVTTRAEPGPSAGPFATDILTVPDGDLNPWNSWMRLGGFDFFNDGDRAAVCTWMGDVWIVEGLGGALGELRWKRVAAGLFQALGVKLVDDVIYVTCRDQIVRLHDLNGDGEIDFYESFNNDHQVTEHFHEFAMGLQRDAGGNFYYAKSARHALPALVPHHGTLLKVTPDGASTEIIATGFRAANGVCLNPDGTFFVTDQEGHWTPKNRINKVRAGGFYGNMMAYHTPESSADSAMEDPLVWITNEMDRSPGELIWITSDEWGPLKGSLLNLSYGTGKIFLVPHETVNGQTQGGVVALPLPPFPTGVMRGRFHLGDGHLYACGMFAWAGNQQGAGGFYRVRYTGGPAHLPVELRAEKAGITVTFTDPLDGSAVVPESFQIKAWDLRRTSNYGSKHYNERSWKVASARLLEDGKTVQLTIPDIAPTWGMEIAYTLAGLDGQQFNGRIHNTIHNLRTP